MKEKKKAEELYKELPLLKRGNVRQIQEWIQDHPEFPKTSAELVIRFLYATYFNLNRTKLHIQNYYSTRLSLLPEVFSCRDVLLQELRSQMDVMEFGVIPNKDPKGNIILVQRLKVFDPSAYDLLTEKRLFCMLIDAILAREGVPKGFTIIYDMTGMSFMHIFRLKVAQVNLFSQYMQRGCPMRLSGIHVVNTLPVIGALMFFLNSYLEKELLDKLIFHSDSYEEIQKFIPLNCLPKDYGGTQPSVEELNKEYQKWMLELRDQFIKDDEENKKFVQMRKPTDIKHANTQKSWTLFD